MIVLENDIVLALATSPSARSTKWRNARISWEDLVNDLSETIRTDETVAEYAALPKDEQGKIKDVGAFVGGYIKGGRRLKGSIEYRQLLTLDIDYGDEDMLDEIQALGFAYVVYSTHKHTPESPRYRLIVPVSRSLSADEYEAAARVLAWKLDINKFDDTTFQPERCMFYPSTPSDGEYVFKHNDAEMLDPDTLLDVLIDWQDPTTWFYSDRVDEVRTRERKELAEDPTTKGGVIGAFCRAFDIDDAILTFLPDVYEECAAMGRNRYTYLGGSTAGGLVTYDGAFAYSHHSTDPAGDGYLLNAFDLVRIHKFGHLDENYRGDRDEPTRLPSFKAMADFAASIDEVKIQMIDDRRSRASASDYDDEGDTPTRSNKDGDDWRVRLENDKNGVRGTIRNCVTILNNEDGVRGTFAYNLFDCREVAMQRAPWDRKSEFRLYPRPLEDTDDDDLYLWFEDVYGISRKENIKSALKIIMRKNKFNPVTDYLDAVEWDGTPRLDTLLIDLFGADDTPYTRAVTRKALVAAVARAYDAGCKFDYVLTIVGEQGTGKSSTIRRLARDWFSDSLTVLNTKDAYEGVQGTWIIELPELASMRRTALEGMKAFLSKTEDRFRVAYGKRVETFPRRCIFIATTNEPDFLQDVTGNRRFWVINTIGRKGSVKWYEYLDSDTVAQIWGEAKQRYAEGEPLFLDDRLELIAKDVQNAHLEQDEKAGLVRKYLDTALPDNWGDMDISERRQYLQDNEAIAKAGKHQRTRVSVIEVWAECYGFDPARIERKDRQPIVKILRGFNDWVYSDKAIKLRIYGTVKVYSRL